MLEGTHPWLTASPSVLSGKNRTAYLFISLFLFSPLLLKQIWVYTHNCDRVRACFISCPSAPPLEFEFFTGLTNKRISVVVCCIRHDERFSLVDLACLFRMTKLTVSLCPRMSLDEWHISLIQFIWNWSLSSFDFFPSSESSDSVLYTATHPVIIYSSRHSCFHGFSFLLGTYFSSILISDLILIDLCFGFYFHFCFFVFLFFSPLRILLFVCEESLVQWRSKAPSWSKETLQEAINSIVTQKMRFTQASSHFNIPKGTLYDNILGKSKRMLVLDELGLDAQDEEAVLDFCCETSVMPYNRRTNKSLESIVAFVEKLKQSKGQPSFKLGNLMGFRWWWAFCKKHNIVSLFYVKNNNNNKSSKNKNNNNNNNNNRSSPSSASSASSGSSNNNNLSPSPPDELIPENLSKPFEEELPVGGGGGGNHMTVAAAAAAAASAFRSINNNNIHLSQAFQLSHAFLLQQQRQNHRHNLRSRTHSVDHDHGDDSDPEPENLSVHRGWISFFYISNI